MIFLNFEFIDHELTKNTIKYLTENEKSFLLKEGESRGFNGTGFKNKTRLIEYMEEKAFINKKELIKTVSSLSRRTTLETVHKMYKLFIKEAPIYIDRERLYKLMLLSSNLMFLPNEKICFTIMFDNPYKQWSADELVKKAQRNNLLDLRKSKIEESLDRHLVNNAKTEALLTCDEKDGVKLYQIQFTNFVYYIRHFDPN